MTKYWLDGCPVRTHFYDALSVLFPAWETAFAKIVAAYKQDIADPVLLRRMDQFIAQETAHGNAHHAHNLRVGATELEAQEFAKIAAVLRRPKMKLWLATMVSIENLAAGLSRWFLRSYGTRSGREFALFRWHSVEELEHKSLAIDLWDALGYTRNDLAKLLAANRWYVLGFISRYVTAKLRADHVKFNFRLVAGAGWLACMLSKLAVTSLRPVHPKFHPDRIDDTALIQRYA